MDCGIRLVAIDMQRAATAEVQEREGMDMVIVTAAHDGALAVLGHAERERGGVDLAWMDRDAVLRAHIHEHASEPVIGNGCDQIRYAPERDAAKRRGDGVAAKRHRIG